MACSSSLIEIARNKRGANRGIGLEFVKQFLKLRSPPKHLFAGCRNPDNAKDLHAIAKEYSNVTVVKLDVTDQNSIDAARAMIESELEGAGLNLLINNAGIALLTANNEFACDGELKFCDLYEITKEDMIQHFQTNAVGPLMVSKTFLPLLKQAANARPADHMSCNKAAIINISSDSGSITLNTGRLYPYRASKAALNMITSCLSLDLKADGILCTAINPGWVKTEMGGHNAVVSLEKSIQHMFSVMEKLEFEEGSGKFYDAETGDLLGW